MAMREGDTNGASKAASELKKFDQKEVFQVVRERHRGNSPHAHGEGDGWKFPHDVSAEERNEIRSKIEAVRLDLQKSSDAMYPRLLKEGKLKTINRFNGQDMPYRYEGYRRDVQKENCKTVILAVLDEDSGLKDKCDGIPIEWLVEAVKVPEPSLSVESVKEAFQSWATQNMKGLSQLERRVLFRWQFFCCEEEKRQWYAEFSKDSTQAESGKRFPAVDKFTSMDDKHDRHSRFSAFGRGGRGSGGPQVVESHTKFKDLRIDSTNAAVSVIAWYKKALGLGFQPRSFDTCLFERAAKRPGELGRSNVTVRHDPLVSRSGYAYGRSGNLSSAEVEISRGAAIDEIQMAHDYCAYLVEGKNYVDDVTRLVLASLDRSTMERAFKMFADMKIHELSVVGKTVRAPDRAVVDVSPMVAFHDLYGISFYGCRIEGNAHFSEFKSLSRFHAEDCEFETLAFLENCANIKWPSFRDCSFVSTQPLGTLKNVEQLFLRGTKGVLDLAFLEGLSSLKQLYIEECAVTNATVVKNLPALKYLDLTGGKGDCNWDEIVLASPNLDAKGVEETISDVARRRMYVKEMRHRKNKSMPIDFQLREAVAANDVSDVKALLEKGASAQAVWKQMPDKWGNTSTEIIKMLLDNGAKLSEPDTREIKEIRQDGTVKIRPAVARGRGMDELWHLCCADESETNRISLLRLILERGCDPNGLIFSGKSALTALLEKHKTNCDDVEIVRMLLEHGADPRNIDDYLRGHLVSSLEDSRFGIFMLYLLLKHGAEIPVAEMQLGRFLLNSPKIDTNLVAAVKFLVKSGIDVNRQDTFHGTPLTYVIEDEERQKAERLGLVALLLECGADPNRRSESGPFGKLPL